MNCKTSASSLRTLSLANSEWQISTQHKPVSTWENGALIALQLVAHRLLFRLSTTFTDITLTQNGILLAPQEATSKAVNKTMSTSGLSKTATMILDRLN